MIQNDFATQARAFFDRYNDQDVPAMLSLFENGGTVEYVPLALVGPATDIGPASWGVLIDAFPDLHNEVSSISVSEAERKVFVDVMIGGTQVKDTFGITNQGKAYWLRHLFVFDIAEIGKIAAITSFWDNADWYSQLGKTSLV